MAIINYKSTISLKYKSKKSMNNFNFISSNLELFSEIEISTL